MATFGWYSEKQRQVVGFGYYRTPSGRTVTVTVTTPTMDHGTGWDDIEFVSEVTELVTSFFMGSNGNAKIEDEETAPPTLPEFKPAPALTTVCSYHYSGLPPCTCKQPIVQRRSAAPPTIHVYDFDVGPKAGPTPELTPRLGTEVGRLCENCGNSGGNYVFTVNGKDMYHCTTCSGLRQRGKI